MSVGSPISIKRVLGAIAATFVGIGFFFAIVGVFGLLMAIVSLVLFIALASMIFRRPQAEGVPR
jgi:hypothetical protein